MADEAWVFANLVVVVVGPGEPYRWLSGWDGCQVLSRRRCGWSRFWFRITSRGEHDWYVLLVSKVSFLPLVGWCVQVGVVVAVGWWS